METASGKEEYLSQRAQRADERLEQLKKLAESMTDAEILYVVAVQKGLTEVSVLSTPRGHGISFLCEVEDGKEGYDGSFDCLLRKLTEY